MSTNLGILYAGGNTVNPTTGTVLVTTGDLSAGYYMFQATFAASVASSFNYEILNAADTVMQTVIIRLAANRTETIPLGYIPIGNNWEIRVRPMGNITGQVSVSIIAILGGVA